MTITKNVSNYSDILLDIQTQFGTISQQPTANSQQPTANSQQVIFTVINSYIYIFANKSSLGIRSVFSLHSVAALFFMPIWARCTENYKLTRDLSPLSARE